MTVYNRQGKLIVKIPLPGLCTSLGWDREGEHLAIAQDFNGLHLILINMYTPSILT